MGMATKSGGSNSQLVPSSWFVAPAADNSGPGRQREAGAAATKISNRKSVERNCSSASLGRSEAMHGQKDGSRRRDKTGGDPAKPGVSVNPTREAGESSTTADQAHFSRPSLAFKDYPTKKFNDSRQRPQDGNPQVPRKNCGSREQASRKHGKPWEKLVHGGRFGGGPGSATSRNISFSQSPKDEEDEDEEQATSVGEGERERMLAAAMAAIEAKADEAALSDVEEKKARGKGTNGFRDGKRKREAEAVTQGGSGTLEETKNERTPTDEAFSGRDEQENKRRKTGERRQALSQTKGKVGRNGGTGEREENADDSPGLPCDGSMGDKDRQTGAETESDSEGDDDDCQIHIVRRTGKMQTTQTGKNEADNAPPDRKHGFPGSSSSRTEVVKMRDRDRRRVAGHTDHRSGPRPSTDRGASFGFHVSAEENRFFPPLAEQKTEACSEDQETETPGEKKVAGRPGDEETAELLRFVPKTLPFAGARRTHTLSIALPASIIDNAQTAELRAALVGQIARTLTVFGVDEIIVYEDVAAAISRGANKDEGHSPALKFFVRNLRYLETPQFLRKSLFPIHPDLRFAGLQNPLDAPHHLRRNEWLPYREGVVIASSKTREETPQGKSESRAPAKGEEVKLTAAEKKRLKNKKGAWVDCGLPAHVWVPDTRLQDGMRVTIRLDPSVRQLQRQPRERGDAEPPLMKGAAVSPDEPPVKAGLYWGYRVRIAQHFQDVFSNCPFSSDGRYDLTVGTSERGTCVGRDFAFPVNYKHMLLVFGGLQGLEAVLLDRQSNCAPCRDPSTLFDMYLNTCPFQRSRTIRAEEAVPITLALLRPYLLESAADKNA
uniref:Putative RNA methyltransferase n=1 Tax=Toxoplasma gondii COUG TaxID=1074873 RepID=A0A2G8XZ32_TOXGO|nr:putative RNA methyltransferase [Toxoplasma gondii COUG]